MHIHYKDGHGPSPRSPRTLTAIRAGAALVGVAAMTAVVSAMASPAPTPSAASSSPAPVPASAPGNWGSSGAEYLGGITCLLPAGGANGAQPITVPMAQWKVLGGVLAYAREDITGSGGSYSPAPLPTFTPSQVSPGQLGLTAAQQSALAYLISGPGSDHIAAHVAEVSADVAAVLGRGGEQARCLGQQGTSRADAAGLWATAQSLAGPYTVDLSLPHNAPVDSEVHASATVRSVSGVPVPGMPVAVRVGPGAMAATGSPTLTTGADGTVDIALTTTTAASAQVTASVSAPITLTGYGAQLDALTAGPAAAVTATGTLTTNQHPAPAVTPSVTGLLLPGGTTPVSVTVTGNDGWPGTGTASVLGPVAEPPGHCSSLSAKQFTAAPTLWKAPVAVPAGPSTPVTATTTPVRFTAPGCYLATATVRLADNPAATARSAATAANVITVLPTAVSAHVAPVQSTRAPMTVTITATHPDGATVTSSVRRYGPASAQDGHCSNVDWNAAPSTYLGTVTLTAPATSPRRPSPQPDGQPIAAPPTTLPTAQTPVPDTASGAVTGSAAPGLGCYSFTVTSTISLGSRSVSAASGVGESPTTTIVVNPAVAVVTGYSGLEHRPQLGTATVSGTYSLPARMTISLLRAPSDQFGCAHADWAHATPAPGSTTVATTGDGSYRFASAPTPGQDCYQAVATVSMDANPQVSVTSPIGADSAFQAGWVATPVSAPVPFTVARPSASRAVAALIASFAVILAAALAVFLFAYRHRSGSRSTHVDRHD